MGQENKATLKHIIVKCLQDKKFKELLISNPKETIEKELSIHLPKELQIKVVEETPHVLYIVLPSVKGEDLSEEELQQVAAGGTLTYVEGIGEVIILSREEIWKG